VRNKVYETGRIFQCGAQGCSDDFWWQARKFIKKGGIGKVLWVQADYSRNSAGGPDDRGGEWNWHIDDDASDNPNAGEAYIDWQQWLGPAPKRPFSKPRFFQFRKFWDYSGGIATDLLYHVLAPITIALDAKAPERATGSGGIFVQHDDREVPDTFMMTLDYPDDYTVVLTSSMANRQSAPKVIRGHKATIRPADKGMEVTAEDEFKEWFKKEFGAEQIVVPDEPRLGHVEKWLECIRTRGEVHLDAETAYRAMAGIKMGVEAYRQDKVIFWDGDKECYVKKHPRPNRASKFPAEKA
jgi:predicted dehydrogenase